MDDFAAFAFLPVITQKVRSEVASVPMQFFLLCKIVMKKRENYNLTPVNA